MSYSIIIATEETALDSINVVKDPKTSWGELVP